VINEKNFLKFCWVGDDHIKIYAVRELTLYDNKGETE